MMKRNPCSTSFLQITTIIQTLTTQISTISFTLMFAPMLTTPQQLIVILLTKESSRKVYIPLLLNTGIY